MKSQDMDNRFFPKKYTRGYNTPPARSLLALFEELKYDLKKLEMENQSSQYFTQLPRGINELDSISQRKQVFIQVVLPLVLSENQKILLIRKNKIFSKYKFNFSKRKKYVRSKI